jgi:formate--tetrahydrofolate ligase
MHGGAAKADLAREDLAALRGGLPNLLRHVENMRKFGLPVVVALNSFTTDTAAEIESVRESLAALGTEAVPCTHWADGAAGAARLAEAVERVVGAGGARFRPLYAPEMPLADKLRTIAREVYRADGVSFPAPVAARLRRFEEAGFGGLGVCVAKTQYSFSADPTRLGAPDGHVLPVREVRLSAGAGFVVAICGDVVTMPGLPRRPAAEAIRLDGQGRVEGLF